MQNTMIAAFAALALAAGAAMAHGDEKLPQHQEKHAKHEAVRSLSGDEKSFGREGDPRSVSRTVRVEMADSMRFSPAELSLRRGETVQFVVRNTGRLMHEMVLGTMQELKDHAVMMKKHPTMEHEEPYMAHVSPGKTETMVWQFTQAGEFYFGCLVPGHFDAGMIGKVTVK